MAFDEYLAARIREALRKKGVVEKNMFGSVGFLLNGNMLVGVWKDSLIARLGPDQGEEALLVPLTKSCGPKTGLWPTISCPRLTSKSSSMPGLAI